MNESDKLLTECVNALNKYLQIAQVVIQLNQQLTLDQA